MAHPLPLPFAEYPPNAAPYLKRASRVRAFERRDLASAASMFLEVFRAGTGIDQAAVERDLEAVFFENPASPEVSASLVCERPDGGLAGFLGVFPTRFGFEGRPVDGASIGVWMIGGKQRSTGAAAALLGHLFRKKLDLLVTDTSNERSFASDGVRTMHLLASHSLRWLKPLRMPALAAEKLTQRLHPAIARALSRNLAALESRIIPVSRGKFIEAAAFRRCGAEAFTARYLELSAHWPVRPLWSAGELAWRLGIAGRRPSLGPLAFGEALDGRGAPVGVYAFHLSPPNKAAVLQILSQPRFEGATVAAVVADADARGLSSVGGQCDPRLMAGLYQLPGVRYRHTCSTLALAPEPRLAQAALVGDALIGGLVGDNWTPLSSEPYR